MLIIWRYSTIRANLKAGDVILLKAIIPQCLSSLAQSKSDALDSYILVW